MPKRIFYSLIMLILLAVPARAQEFDCEVTIDDDDLEGTNFEYVKTNLKPALESYINEFRWTEIEFTEQERIICRMTIVLTGGDQNFNFTAETLISARRPIYNSMSQTTALSISDPSWQFNYPEGKSLLHDELQFEPLTGFIDYYMYLLLGYDFDSFSPLGGTPYFVEAQNVVDLAQNVNTIGWQRTSNNRRNRFILVNDMLSNNYDPLRNAYYTYHRKGLDIFTEDPEQARQNILTALTNIRDAKRKSTSNFLYDLFFDTKSGEIISVFGDAEGEIRLEAYDILRDTDTGHLTEYEQLVN